MAKNAALNKTEQALIEAAEASDEIAARLRVIADGMEHLLNSGLTEDAVVILLKHRITNIRIADVRAVVRALPQLRLYLA